MAVNTSCALSRPVGQSPSWPAQICLRAVMSCVHLHYVLQYSAVSMGVPIRSQSTPLGDPPPPLNSRLAVLMPVVDLHRPLHASPFLSAAHSDGPIDQDAVPPNEMATHGCSFCSVRWPGPSPYRRHRRRTAQLDGSR